MDDTPYTRGLKREEIALELHQRPKGMRGVLRWLRVHGRLWRPFPDRYWVHTQEELDRVLRDGDEPVCTGNGKFVILRPWNTRERWWFVQVYGSATLDVAGLASRGWANKIFVGAWGQAKITTYGNVRVEAGDQTQVEGHDWADISAQHGAKVTAYDDALVEAGDQTEVELFDRAYVSAGGRARVRAHDDTRVDAHGDATVVADGAACVYATTPENVEIRGNARVQPWEIDRE